MITEKQNATKGPVEHPDGAIGQVVLLIKEGINSGKFQPDDMLPSENAFAKKLGISRWSVREGLSRLESDGLVRKVPGKGTFISSANMGGSKFRIGMLIDSHLSLDQNIYMLELLKYVRARLAMRGSVFRLLNEIVDFTRDNHSDLLDDFNSNRLDALIAIPSSFAGVQYLNSLSSRGKKVIVFGAKLDNKELSRIEIDSYTGAKNAIEYLIQLGHQRITLLSPYEDNSHLEHNMYDSFALCRQRVISRHAGYKDAMKEAGLEYTHENIVDVDIDLSKTIEAVTTMFKRKNRPSALFITDGRIIQNVLHALAINQIQIPEDVSVITFDDFKITQTYSPPITVVRQPLDVVADNIVNMLTDNKPVYDIDVPVELILRKSCIPNKINAMEV